MKQTKIIATISNYDVDFLKELYEKGVDVFRINTAHQDEKESLKAIKNIRKVSEKIPIIIDTKGPELRITNVEEEFYVEKKDLIEVRGNSKKITSKNCIFVDYDNFVRDLNVGNVFLYDDGCIEFKVVEKRKDFLRCEVLNSGLIRGRKSINVPGVKINLPSVSKKDKDYIEFSMKNGVDFIAHSFIRNKEDLSDVQKILDKGKSKIKLIAKIENQEGVDNIDEILDNCFGVMVARGDLAIEIPAQRVPIVQKEIMKRCICKRKVVITATQMLHSMMENPRPTRAEVSDVANAIYDGTDCIMLSGETASGKYPIESARTMKEIALEVENAKPHIREMTISSYLDAIPVFLARSAVDSSFKLPIKAIITDTLSGRTARYLAAYRGKANIYALCYSEKVLRELALSYGVYAEKVKKDSSFLLVKKKIERLVEEKKLGMNDLIVVLVGSFSATEGASRLEIAKVRNILRSKS